jgi:hypothetical protein
MDDSALFPGGTVSREKLISQRCRGDVALKHSAAERSIDSWNL